MQFIRTNSRRHLPPLVLTGGPAVGKSVTGRRLAENRGRAAFVVAGAEAPWRGPEGTAQAALGAENACGLARRFLANGFDVVVADVLTPATTEIYRRELAACRIVHLGADPEEARRRAMMRPVGLTDEEFELLHLRNDAHPPDVDVRLQVAALDLGQQIAAVADCWAADAD